MIENIDIIKNFTFLEDIVRAYKSMAKEDINMPISKKKSTSTNNEKITRS